ncbi:hypothetical protein Slin15195_G050470 [Septoria linicola]|uniref:Uncharacterized protein n=1 Tax=Septoria linicola TaxID=215465 RepID=A0A9Q9ARB1_9PEZI|nr:hypothetical protein Slin15195_G050470 [Septoria linicola]
MPSSSTASTSQERLITHNHKVLCARLWHSGFEKETRYITPFFVAILETTEDTLYQHACEDDPKWWKQMQEYCNKKARSESVYVAGNMTADSAAVLFKFGRKEEAERLCELAEQIYGLAVKVEEDEKRYESWSYKY